MTDDAAVQAATDALEEYDGLHLVVRRDLARRAVEAARPIERATALREAADEISADDFGTSDAHDPDYWAGLADAASYLRRAAVEAARPSIDAEQRSKDAAEDAVICSSSRMIEKAYRLGWERAAVRTEPIEDLVERSSLGTPEAQRLRESVSDEDAREVVRRAAAMRTEPENG